MRFPDRGWSCSNTGRVVQGNRFNQSGAISGHTRKHQFGDVTVGASQNKAGDFNRQWRECNDLFCQLQQITVRAERPVIPGCDLHRDLRRKRVADLPAAFHS